MSPQERPPFIPEGVVARRKRMETGEPPRKRVGHAASLGWLGEGRRGQRMRGGDLVPAASALCPLVHALGTQSWTPAEVPALVVWPPGGNSSPTGSGVGGLAFRLWEGLLPRDRRGSAFLGPLGHIELIVIICLLQERDIELELGDDYILDLQSKGWRVILPLKCQLCIKCFRKLEGLERAQIFQHFVCSLKTRTCLLIGLWGFFPPVVFCHFRTKSYFCSFRA